MDTAYNNFFKHNADFPKYKSKHKSIATYTTNLVKGKNENANIVLGEDYILLPTSKEPVKLKQHRKAPKDYGLKSATVKKTPIGNYYVSVLFEYESQIQKIKPIKFWVLIIL